MVNFPVINRLKVSGYGLYPGQPAGTGLSIEFQKGLTLVIGANGLGKTTLVHILFRTLTGPYDIRGLDDAAELGTRRLDARPISPSQRSQFSQRVADSARHATAELAFQVGRSEFVVERRLTDLSLVRLTLDRHVLEPSDDVYQEKILGCAGLGSFGDWILLLRHLVFYFEDRRALVWDPSAQRQILRFLFLSTGKAQEWLTNERAILEQDSHMRNLLNVTTRDERDLARATVNVKAAGDVRQEVQTLGQLQAIDQERHDTLEEQVPEIELARQNARIRLLNAEQEREGKFREMERAKLMAISARFPSRAETARYILAQLMSDHSCLVCDHVSPQAASEYEKRIAARTCVVCGTDLSAEDDLVPHAHVADKRFEKAATELGLADNDLVEAHAAFDDSQKLYFAHFKELSQLVASTSERAVRLESLTKLLPPEDQVVDKRRADLAALKARVSLMQAELAELRKEFSLFVEGVNTEIVTRADLIRERFHSFAQGFLLERCELAWAPQRARLGQTGELIAFPAFDIEMTGSDFTAPVVRSGPDRVSESQREFIDLAFRMALMAVGGGSEGVGTLVIDAPESSLDAVFVTRAAEVLARFALQSNGNRLVVTSNLVDGRLIPTLIHAATVPGDRAGRIVDLFHIATPTAAVRELRAEYDRCKTDLLGDIAGDER